VDGSVTLTGTGDALGYLWSGGVVDGVAFTLATTTTFTVTGVNAFGCITTDDITITVIDCEPLIAGFSFDDLVCQGQCITLTDTSLGDPVEWLWDFGGGATPVTSTDENPLVCFDTPGIFNIQLTVTNALGESASTTNSITVFATPTVDAERDTIIDLGGVANLLATASVPGGTYTWTPDDFIECDNCPTTTSNSPEEIVYIVTFVDVNGCSATDSVRVFVNFIEAIGVADAFTPNGDGVNDVLNVMGFGLEAITFSIFNKYGEKVFESQTQLIGWDGTFRGRDQNPGVFTWVLEYQFVNGKTGVINGTTTLVR
jgi:gliding motility-associated-like protein